MGRYYDTDGGRRGKFMFGVQASDDPGYMGMHEQEPISIDYYADADDVEHVKSKLDEQYDILGIPENKRIYYCKDNKQMSEYEDKVLHDKVFVTVHKDDKEAKEKYKGKTAWWSGKGNEYTDYEINNNALALARIRLALDILSDIEDNTFCSLTAEL